MRTPHFDRSEIITPTSDAFLVILSKNVETVPVNHITVAAFAADSMWATCCVLSLSFPSLLDHQEGLDVSVRVERCDHGFVVRVMTETGS